MQRVSAVLAASALLAVCPASAAAKPGALAAERALLAADERQRAAVTTGDLAAIAAISHPDLRVNAPTGLILTNADLIRMVASGEIRNETLERTPEKVTITGEVGMVMGTEIVRPGAGSEQARQFGTSVLKRRYTNVYLRTRGGWLHWARHANVVR